MKQYITINDLNQLSDKGKGRLREWWKPKYGDWLYHYKPYNFNDNCDGCDEPQLYHNDNDEGSCVGNDYDHPIDDSYDNSYLNLYLPLLSIGQIIEFLKEKSELRIDITIVDIYSNDDWCEIGIGSFGYDGSFCDALWSQCKEILERE